MGACGREPPEGPEADELGRLAEAVAGLPEVEREVIRGRFWREERLSDVAEALGRTKEAVRLRQQTAIKRLRRRLGGKG